MKKLFDTSGITPDETRLLSALAAPEVWGSDDLRRTLSRTSEKRAGIYAFYGDETAWDLIETMARVLPDGYRDLSRPVYIGIHNDVVGRLSEHLGLCRPDSTYRCSLIALLHDTERWNSIAPRYRTKAKPSDYRLGPDENEKLNRWIAEHLRVSVWSSTKYISYMNFGDWENRLIEQLMPPLNVQHSVAPTVFALRRERAAMARIAGGAPHTIRYLDGKRAILVPRRDIA